MNVRSVLLASVCAALVLLPSSGIGLAAGPSKSTLQLVQQGYKALGARDYAQARCEANAAWRPHVRTPAMDDAGERWQAVAAALAAVCPRT